MNKTDYLEDMEPVNEDHMVAEPQAEGPQDSDDCGTYPNGAVNDD